MNWSLSFLFFSLCFMCAYRGSECVRLFSAARARPMTADDYDPRLRPQNTFRVYNFFKKTHKASAKNDVSTILLKILGEAAA